MSSQAESFSETEESPIFELYHSSNRDELPEGLLDENLLRLIRKAKAGKPKEAQASRRNSYTISYLDYLLETSEEERHLLSSAVESVIANALHRGRSVYLDGLGVLYPIRRETTRTQVSHDRLLLLNEIEHLVGFEKSYEIDSFLREKYPEIVEIHELGEETRRTLPGYIRWDQKVATRYVRGLFQLIKYQVVVEGLSEQFESIGQFFSLHNRQGSKLSNWYAGADIFLRSHSRREIASGSKREFPRPILRDAWEPFESYFGAPTRIFNLNTAEELGELGYDETLLPDSIRKQRLKIAVFSTTDPDSGKEILIYCSEGMRRFGIDESKEKELGTELVMQIEREGDTVPEWPIRAFTIGWILLNSSRTKNASVGDGMSVGLPVADFEDTPLTTLFVTPFRFITSEQLSSDGPFLYRNIVGVTEDEAHVASRYSPDFLLAFLEHKHFDQLTKPNRRSVISKSRLPSGDAPELFLRL